MYNLPYFKENDNGVVMEFIRNHPFAFIAGVDADNKPVATQIPVFIDERDGKLFLSGHIMKGTDHYKAFLQNPDVLAVFTGPHSYVSASWYDDPKQASTWNYMSVHAKGVLSFKEEEALLEILKRTTDHYENNPHSGSNFHDLSKEYVHKLINAIVVFEIEVTSLNNVFKLSQNRNEKSFDNITEQLQKQGGDGELIAEEMKNRRSQLFNKKK